MSEGAVVRGRTPGKRPALLILVAWAAVGGCHCVDFAGDGTSGKMVREDDGPVDCPAHDTGGKGSTRKLMEDNGRSRSAVKTTGEAGVQ